MLLSYILKGLKSLLYILIGLKPLFTLKLEIFIMNSHLNQFNNCAYNFFSFFFFCHYKVLYTFIV
jgi:hypothetical protein